MYSSISSKIYTVKKIMSEPCIFLVGEIWREENKQNLQICHAATSATRVNQGVEPWVLQRPLASFARASVNRSDARVTTACWVCKRDSKIWALCVLASEILNS